MRGNLTPKEIGLFIFLVKYRYKDIDRALLTKVNEALYIAQYVVSIQFP